MQDEPYLPFRSPGSRWHARDDWKRGGRGGDIESVDVEPTQQGTADFVTVTGTITCAKDLTYGMGVQVTQPATGAEAVGLGGPGRKLDDDQPCRAAGTEFDIVTGRTSTAPFDPALPPLVGGVKIDLGAGTQSAGGRDPFIGDLFFATNKPADLE